MLQAVKQRIDVLLTAPMITWRKENTKIGNSSRLLSTFPFFGVKKTSWGAHNTDELNMQLAARPNEQWHNKAKTILKAHFYWCFQRNGTVQLFGTKGQKFIHCPGTKEQRENLKIVPRDSLSKSRADAERDGTKFWQLSRPVPRDKTGQSRKGRSNTERDVF